MWDIIRQAANDIADMNNVEFMDETWERLRQMERELIAFMDEADNFDPIGIWQAMPEPMQKMLITALNENSVYCARYDPGTRTHIDELADYDYVNLVSVTADGLLVYQLTLKGRYILKANGV